MHTSRQIAHAPRSRALSRDIAAMTTACVGCEGCQGICATLIEAMTLPETILREKAA